MSYETQTTTERAPWDGIPSAQMRADWIGAFTTMKTGQSLLWAGGILTMQDDGQLHYEAHDAINGGVTLNVDTIDNPEALRLLVQTNPGIAKQWAAQYGINTEYDATMAAYYARTKAFEEAGKSYGRRGFDDPNEWLARRKGDL